MREDYKTKISIHNEEKRDCKVVIIIKYFYYICIKNVYYIFNFFYSQFFIIFTKIKKIIQQKYISL